VVLIAAAASYQFYHLTVRDCDADTKFFTCVATHLSSRTPTVANTFDDDGPAIEPIRWGIAFAAYLSVWLLLGLWIWYQVWRMRAVADFSSEVPSFTLWIARNIRTG
jgi:hypothetical protein